MLHCSCQVMSDKYSFVWVGFIEVVNKDSRSSSDVYRLVVFVSVQACGCMWMETRPDRLPHASPNPWGWAKWGFKGASRENGPHRRKSHIHPEANFWGLQTALCRLCEAESIPQDVRACSEFWEKLPRIFGAWPRILVLGHGFWGLD